MRQRHKTRSVFERYHIVDETDLADAASRLDTKRMQQGWNLLKALGSIQPNRTKTAAVGQIRT